MADPFRLLVTGSRNWDNSIMIHSELYAASDALLERQGASSTPIIVIHGACRSGADAIAAAWCFERANLLPGYFGQEPHPADWNQYGKRAGFIRNAEMVALGADLCLAFVLPCELSSCRSREPHTTHGTGHCIALARKAGIPVKEVRGD